MAPKKETKKMSLGEFMNDDKYGSWADEMEDMPTIPVNGQSTGYGNRRNDHSGGNRYNSGGGFGGPNDRHQDRNREDRDNQREERFNRRAELPLPTKPPFTAHVGNLSFDATEDDISRYFVECSISNVRLVRDRMGDRPKGFGYVEFQTLDGLKKALELNNGQLAGRNVRVSVADPPKERPDDRTNVDTWRRSGPLPSSSDAPQMRRQNSRFNDNASEAGSERFERRPSGFNRENQEGDGKFRDFSNWERKGPLPPATPTESESGRPPRHEKPDRRRSPATNPFEQGRQPSFQGEERPKREYQRPPAPERAPTAAEKDNEWRKGARPDVPIEQIKSVTTSPSASAPSAPAQQNTSQKKEAPTSPSAPQQRPRLNLQKRGESGAVETAQATSSDPKASPFGAARPIDTDTKLREIEEKRAVQAAEKKAQQDKVKEDKKAAKAAEKAEKVEKTEKNWKANKAEGEPETPNTGRNFEILRRTSAATDDISAADVDAEEPTTITKEEAKPVQKPTPKVNLPSDPSTKQLEDEGWSTVKRGRGANGKA